MRRMKPLAAQEGLKNTRLRRRGLSLTDVTVALVTITILATISIPLLGSGRNLSDEIQSLNNLAQLGQAHACYASDWNDRQVTWIPDDYAEVNDCDTYINERRCIESMILGWADFDGGRALWGYWIGNSSSYCSFGGTSNIIACTPLTAIDAVPPAFSYGGFGSFRLPNGKAFMQYASSRYYSQVWYAPGDPNHARAAVYFGDQDEFNYDGTISFSSYCLSPAAMIDPDALRDNADGGYQGPETLPTYYQSPTVNRCAYPELKTRMLEHNWFRGSPTPLNDAYAGPPIPWLFNQGMAARPCTLFFDGSVDYLPTIQAWSDDLIVQGGTKGQSSLWSRDTEFGADGYSSEYSLEGIAVNHHVLTTNGIRGRDILNRSGGRP